MAHRSTSVKTQHHPPSVETVIDETDEALELSKGQSDHFVPNLVPKPLKRCPKSRRIHKSASTSAADKERGRRVLRYRNNDVVDGDLRYKSIKPDPRVDPPSRLEQDFARYFPQLGKIVELGRADDRARYRTMASTRSQRSSSGPILKEAYPDRSAGKSVRRSSVRLHSNSPYGHGNTTSPSVISNLTAVSGRTNNSSGSSGSNSTITQESISKQRKSVLSPSRKNEGTSEPTPGSNRSKDVLESSLVKETPNVFSFLEKGPTSPIPQDDPGYPKPIEGFYDDNYCQPNVARSLDDSDDKENLSSSPVANSLHSDSGISVRGDSPERRRPNDHLDNNASGQNKMGNRKHHSKGQMPASRELPTSNHHSAPTWSSTVSGQGSNPGDDHHYAGYIPQSQHPFSHAEPPVEPLRRVLSEDFGYALPLDPAHHYPDSAMNYDHFSDLSSPLDPLRPSPRVNTASFSASRMSNSHMTAPTMAFESDSSEHRSKSDVANRAHVQRSGYDLLASNLCSLDSDESREERALVPLYRRFETLNHRLFLHLQDEIVELEEELRKVDEMDAQMRSMGVHGNGDGSNKANSASRRSASRLSNGLDWRRMEVMGKIFNKLGFYNQALCSYNNLIKGLDPASQEDIEKYQAWMTKCNPIVESEGQFLQEKSDLISIRHERSPISSALQRSNKTTQQLSGRLENDVTTQFLISSMAAAILLPVLTFVVVPGFLARVFIVLVMAGAALAFSLSRSPPNTLYDHNHAKCAAV
ncbi:MAG: hypothetical protein M1837_002897 [Sclerophora amabilis]|nr:MAG: hypothetical protein M1837_002897 [Sclerophora amabilis]